MFSVELVNNMALLLALALFHVLLTPLRPSRPWPVRLASGLAIGAIGVALMMNPWSMSPGLFFDTRTVLLSISGLFMGHVPTMMGIAITALYRAVVGGEGIVPGLGTIATAGFVGMLWRRVRRGDLADIGTGELALMGVMVSVATVLWMLTLPWPLALDVVQSISIPVLVLFPAATVFMGKLFALHLAKARGDAKVAESEQQYRELVEGVSAIFLRLQSDGAVTFLNEFGRGFFGRASDASVGGMTIDALTRADGLGAEEIVSRLRRAGRERRPLELEVENADGEPACIAWRVRAADADDAALAGELVCVGTDITIPKCIERTLRESEQRYRALFEENPHPMWVWDLETLAFVDVNEAAIANYGYTREEFLGMTLRDIRAPEELDRFDAHVRTVPEATYRAGIWRHRRKDGSDVLAEITSHPLVIGGRRVRLVLCEDVTERERTEAELRRRREIMSFLFANAPIMILQQGPDGRIEWVNRHLEETLGWTLDELRSRDMLADIYPDPAYRAKVAKFIEDAEGRWAHFRARRRDGEFLDTLWADLALSDGTRVGIGQDVTELNRAKADRDLFFNHSVDMFAIAAVDGTYRQLNPAWERTLGWAPEEMQGKSWLHFVHPDDRESTAAAGERLALGIPVTAFENRLRCSDGSYRLLSWNAWPQQEQALIFSIARDVTRRAALESRLRQAQKMEAIGQLAGGVAHDFNNILQAILGYVDLVTAEVPADAPYREDLLDVRRAAERAADLTHQLLAFSRRQVLDPHDVDLNDVVAEASRMIRRVIGEHVQLEVVPGHNLGTVHADRGQLLQVILNLCINARDAMPDGGKITVETENVVFDTAYCRSHDWAIPGRFVLLSVTDTGCGIPSQDLERVFDPFYTTKGPGKGTGLGLSTVYGIVRQHGGMVQAYSEVGSGTLFKVYLPMTERRASGVGRTIEGRPRGGFETILVAEDDVIVRRLAVRVLEDAGYTVLAAEDGKAALELFRAGPGRVDLALVDVVMPQMGGYQLMTEMRRVRPEVRVLFTSGYSENAVHTDFVLKEGIRLLQKPYERDQLLRRVREALDGAASPSREA